MLQGILRVLLTIMASSQGEDNEEDEMLGEEELGTQSPGSYAAQVNIFNWASIEETPPLSFVCMYVGFGCIVTESSTRASVPSCG